MSTNPVRTAERKEALHQSVAAGPVLMDILEPRLLLSASYPTSYEQYLLELINRARANPLAEAARWGIELNEGLEPGTITPAAKEPLAMNLYLVESAQRHSLWMLQNTFGHIGIGGSDPGDRMSAAGYIFSGDWSWGENIAWHGESPSFPELTTSTAAIHADLFVDEGFTSRGHRVNILDPFYREAGTGIMTGKFQGYNAVMATEDFAKSGSNIYLTGVAYNDTLVSADSFYTPGEGLGGVAIVARRQSDGAQFTTSTWASGGYSRALPPGTYNVSASGGGLGTTLTFNNVVINDRNVKVDFTPAATEGLIGGSKWNDLNGNGTWDAGELPIAAWTIYLDQNQNAQLDPGETAVMTDANGNYSFTKLSPGTYTVREVPQAGWVRTLPQAGYYTVILTAGQSILGRNFANTHVPSPPEVTVRLGNTNVVDGRSTLNVGTGQSGLAGPTLTFTIVNDGENPLTLTTPFADLPHFALGQPGLTSIAGGLSTTFTATLLTDEVGSFSEELSFGNNDANENPFNFRLTGTVEGPTDTVTIGDGHAASVTFTDADGTLVSVTHVGGTATLHFTGTDLWWQLDKKGGKITGTDIQWSDVVLDATTDRSRLTVTTNKGGDALASVGGIAGSSPMGTLAGRTLDLVAAGIDMTLGGYIGALQLHDVKNGADINMAGTGAAKGIALTANRILADTDITLGAYLRSLTAVEWMGLSLTAPWAADINVTGTRDLVIPGNLTADVTLTGQDGKGTALGRLKVAGRIVDAEITALAGGVGSLAAGQWDSGSLNTRWVKSLTMRGGRGGLTGSFGAAMTLTGTLAPADTLGSANFTGNLSGAWSITGKVGSIAAAGTVNGWTLNDASALRSAALGNVTGAVVDVEGPIGSITAKDWSAGTLTAASVKSLKTTGDKKNLLAGNFNAAVDLDGSAGANITLDTARIAGDLGGKWDITGQAGTISAAGRVDAWELALHSDLKSLNLGNVTGAVVDVEGSIGGITAKDWSAGTVSAAALGSLKVTGDKRQSLAGQFIGTVDLGAGKAGSVSIAGNWSGGWTCGSVKGIAVKGSAEAVNLTLTQAYDPRAQSLGSLNVTLWLRNSVIRSSGSIGAAAAGGMDGTKIFAGLADLVPPALISDFVSPCTVGNVSVKGIKVGGAFDYSFINTVIAARYFGTVVIRYAQTANPTPFGVYADSIKTLTVTDASGTTTWRNPTDTKTFGDMEVKLL